MGKMEKLNEAYEELKRVDHLIYVSLKYTRTVDVILNILTRTVDAYALMTDGLIEYAKEQGKIIHEPESAIERAELIKSLFADDDVVVDNMQLYLLERKLLRAKNVERENEYRRHVTMKTVVEGREEIVNIDIITNYFLYQREFLNHVRNIVEGKATAAVRDQQMSMPDAPAWMSEAQHEEEEEKTAPPPPPTKQPMKVRPVTAPPRKRAPRPKKYKIQIPKGKNPIMRVPFEHDPKYNKELNKDGSRKTQKEIDKIRATDKKVMQKEAREDARKARKSAKRSAPVKLKKTSPKPKKAAPKKAVKKKR